MDSIAAFLEMGGHAAYVWPAYVVTALVLAALAVQSVVAVRRRAAEIARLEAALPARRHGRDAAKGKPDDA